MKDTRKRSIEAVEELVGKLADIARECRDEETKCKIVVALYEYRLELLAITEAILSSR